MKKERDRTPCRDAQIVRPSTQGEPGALRRQARPIYQRTRDSIEAHLTIVFAALAVSRWIENASGWSIRRFVTTARRYRTYQIQAGPHVIPAADPLPGHLHDVLQAISSSRNDS